MRLLAYLQSLAWCIFLVHGNVEKTIFLAPEAIQIPLQHPNLEDLNLEVLSPSKYQLRRQLPAAFPTPTNPKGIEAWFLLERLTQHQRYEVRICWAATQPTSFTLTTYSLPQVFDTPELITSLATYSDLRQAFPLPARNLEHRRVASDLDSLLFLQVFAAADYFTTNSTLMQNVPPVNVEISEPALIVNYFRGDLILLIVLDPFLLNQYSPGISPDTSGKVSVGFLELAKSRMPHSTLQRQDTETRKSIEERFQAGLQLQALYALPIYQLPAELMLNILARVELRDYPSLITATWHLLRHKGIAPTWPTARLKQILVEPRCGFYGSFEDVIDQSRPREGYLPFNLRKHILHHLAPRPSFFTTFTNVELRLRGGFEHLPTELRDAIFQHFDPATNILVALACFRFSDRDIQWLTHEKV